MNQILVYLLVALAFVFYIIYRLYRAWQVDKTFERTVETGALPHNKRMQKLLLARLIRVKKDLRQKVGKRVWFDIINRNTNCTQKLFTAYFEMEDGDDLVSLAKRQLASGSIRCCGDKIVPTSSIALMEYRADKDQNYYYWVNLNDYYYETYPTERAIKIVEAISKLKAMGL